MFLTIEVVFLTVVVIKIIISLFLQILFKDKKVYSYNLIYLLALFCKFWSLHFIIFFPHPALNKALRFTINQLCNLFVIYSLALFIIHFIPIINETERFFKWIKKMLEKFYIHFPISMILSYFGLQLINEIILAILALSGSILSSIIFYQSLYKVKKHFRFIFIGSSAMLTGSLISIFIYRFFNIQEIIIFVWYPLIIVEMLCFLFALIYESHCVIKDLQKSEHENLVLEKRRTEEEFKAQKAKLSPHFIQNSFDFIARSLHLQEKDQIIKSLQKLSNYFHFVLANSDLQIVSIEDELIFTQNYLEIQRMITKNLFSYQVIVDDAADTLTEVPSMILQPIVENSIKHGFRGSNIKYHIVIQVEETDKEIKIIVIDNGEGISMDKKNKYLTSHGMAISERRLKLLANNRHQNMQLNSENIKYPNRGVKTTITFYKTLKTNQIN